MARWGNALGGWKKQTRNSKGQFGSGKSGPHKSLKHPYGKGKSGPKRASVKPKPKTKSSPKKSPSKSTAKSTTQKPMSKKKKAAIAVGSAAVVAGVAYGAYRMESNKLYKEVASMGGGLYTENMGKFQKTTFNQVKGVGVGIDPGHLLRGTQHKEAGNKIRSAAHFAASARVKVRPRIDTTIMIHQGSELHGYMRSESVGNKYIGQAAYLKESSRGNKSIISGISKEIKSIQGQQVSGGRKVLISKYRSADSERIVRNQAKKLGKENVIVQKRFDPGFDVTPLIQSNMDDYFSTGLEPAFSNILKKSRKKAGVVI